MVNKITFREYDKGHKMAIKHTYQKNAVAPEETISLTKESIAYKNSKGITKEIYYSAIKEVKIAPYKNTGLGMTIISDDNKILFHSFNIKSHGDYCQEVASFKSFLLAFIKKLRKQKQVIICTKGSTVKLVGIIAGGVFVFFAILFIVIGLIVKPSVFHRFRIVMMLVAIPVLLVEVYYLLAWFIFRDKGKKQFDLKEPLPYDLEG